MALSKAAQVGLESNQAFCCTSFSPYPGINPAVVVRDLIIVCFIIRSDDKPPHNLYVFLVACNPSVEKFLYSCGCDTSNSFID